MAEVLAIVGPSGSGKSTSLRHLNPSETFIIGVDSKGLPFQGWKRMYTPCKATNFSQGNYVLIEDPNKIKTLMKRVADERPEIKTLVIDDYQYIMGNEFMEKYNEKGYDKFSSIGYNGWSPIKTAKEIKRDDLTIVFLFHEDSTTDKEYNPVRKIKTIGKMVDEKYTLEGMFRIVLFTKVVHDAKAKTNSYFFETQTDGVTTAKSPMGMFGDFAIPNDLDFVIKRMQEYDLGVEPLG